MFIAVIEINIPKLYSAGPWLHPLAVIVLYHIVKRGIPIPFALNLNL